VATIQHLLSPLICPGGKIVAGAPDCATARDAGASGDRKEPAAMLQPNMSFLTASDGIRLAWRVDDFSPPWRSPGTPVLLLHAAMGSYRRWFGWIPELARHVPTLSLELRGHGASQVPGEAQPLTVERLVADVVELLDHLGVARAHVVGLSAGGYVGQRLAMEHPGRVATLALYASTPGLKNSDAGTWPAKAAAMGLEAFMRAHVADRFPADADPGLVDWFCRQTGSNDLAFVGRFVAHMSSRDWEDELPRIRCPTLIVAPGHEPIGSHDQYERMQALIPDARLLSLEGMPHNIGDAAPEACVRALLEFLAERG
jgi:pimeloyl-ACP methyl ester carboxylesterase